MDANLTILASMLIGLVPIPVKSHHIQDYHYKQVINY